MKNENQTAVQLVSAEWKGRFDEVIYNVGNYCEAFSFLGQAVDMGTDTSTLGNTLLALHHGFNIVNGQLVELGIEVGVKNL